MKRITPDPAVRELVRRALEIAGATPEQIVRLVAESDEAQMKVQAALSGLPREKSIGPRPVKDDWPTLEAGEEVLDAAPDGNHSGNGICPYCEARWKNGLVVNPVA